LTEKENNNKDNIITSLEEDDNDTSEVEKITYPKGWIIFMIILLILIIGLSIAIYLLPSEVL
jgi:quinol-cytochrome oxidoreductase complex cytochrome b subunit